MQVSRCNYVRLDLGLIRLQLKAACPFGLCIFKIIPISDHKFTWGVYLEVRGLELDKISGWIDSHLGLFWVVQREDLRSLSGHFRKLNGGHHKERRILQQSRTTGIWRGVLAFELAYTCWGPVKGFRSFDERIYRVPFSTEIPDFWKGRIAFILIWWLNLKDCCRGKNDGCMWHEECLDPYAWQTKEVKTVKAFIFNA